MKNSTTCPKCQSTEIIRVPGWMGRHGSGHYVPIGLTGFNSAVVTRYICGQCGYIEDWIDSPEDLARIRDEYAISGDGYGILGDDMKEPTECLSCGETIPSGSSACPKCGWSYKDGPSGG